MEGLVGIIGGIDGQCLAHGAIHQMLQAGSCDIHLVKLQLHRKHKMETHDGLNVEAGSVVVLRGQQFPVLGSRPLSSRPTNHLLEKACGRTVNLDHFITMTCH